MFNHPDASTPRPDCNRGDFLSLCIPLNALKPTDKMCQNPKEKTGLRGCHVGSKQGELGRGQSHLDTIYELNGRKQHPLSQKTLPCANRLKYVHANANSAASVLPYWKNADRQDPPVRTLFRTKKWIDSDEQGCKRVSCVLECEQINSRYSTCSCERIDMTLTQQDKAVLPSKRFGVCTCLRRKRRENPRLLNGNKLFGAPASEKSCHLNNEGKIDQADGYVHGQNELCFLDPRQKRCSGNGNGIKTVRVEAVQSSKCIYLRRNGGSSYIASNNQLVLRNTAYIAPNVVCGHPDKINPGYTHLNLGQSGMKSIHQEKFVKGPLLPADNLEQFGEMSHKTIDVPLERKKNNIFADSFGKYEESGQKFATEGTVYEDSLKSNKTVQSENALVATGKKEPKTVLDVLEVDTLAKANNILEKIASTLDQIKVLNQMSFPQHSVTGCNTITGKVLSGGDADCENMEKTVSATDIKPIEKERKQQEKENVAGEKIEDMRCDQDEEKTIAKSAIKSIIKERFDDGNGKNRENKNSAEKRLFEDTNCDDLNAIPLKITKAVSAFKTVETNLASNCIVLNSQGIKVGQGAKKSHSINLIKKTVIVEKCKKAYYPRKIPEENLLHHNSSKENEEKNLQPDKGTKCWNESDSLATDAINEVRKQSSSHNEGSDRKKVTTVALESMLKTALSPKRNFVESSMKGNEEKAEKIKMNTSTNKSQYSATSRLSALAQPRTSYIKALKREFKHFLDKPRLERLDRMIDPDDKQHCSPTSDSKPPVPPIRSLPPKKTGNSLRNKSVDSAGKRNVPTDSPPKKLRPQTSPNKARGEAATLDVAVPPSADEASPRKLIDERTESARPSSVPASSRTPSRSPSGISRDVADKEGESPQSKSPIEKGALSPLVSIAEDGPTRRSRHRRSSPPARVVQKRSEGWLSGDVAVGEDEESFGKEDPTESSTMDGESPTKRMRARTCGRRSAMVRSRRRRYATCCFPLRYDAVLSDGYSSSYDFFVSRKFEGAGDPNQSALKKQFNDRSVNVSLTLNNEALASSKLKTEEGYVKSAKEGKNQIIFNVYQVTGDNKMVPEVTSGGKAQREEQDDDPTTNGTREDLEKAPELENVESARDKLHKEGTVECGDEVKDVEQTRVRSHEPDGAPLEAGGTRGRYEVMYRNQVGGLSRVGDGGAVEVPRGNYDGLLGPPEMSQYVPVVFEGPQAPFGAVKVACDCGGCEASSDGCKTFAVSQTESQSEFSVPLRMSDCVSEDCCESSVCPGCIGSGGDSHLANHHKGRQLPRPFRGLARTDLRQRGEFNGEENPHVVAPVGIPSSGPIKEWLRDSNVDVWNWSNKLTFKVDVGTSVSGFHVAVPSSDELPDIDGSREVLSVVGEEAMTRRDVACSTKRSSVTIVWKGNCEVGKEALSERCTPKRPRKKVATSVVPSKRLALVRNIRRRNMLVLAVYALLYVFLGWVVLLPSYYL